MPTEVAPGVIQIDTALGGWPQVTAGYLLAGTAPLLVETGSQSSVATVLAALGDLGLGPADLAGVAVTHVHLDHAGGVGDVARAFPEATVYVHERGARHLADPSRLVASAARVYGDRLDSLFGRLAPTDPDRIRVLGEGDRVTVGHGRVLIALDSPGHARHHLAFHDSASGLLFAGDAAGVRLPDVGVLWPATPPPDFDLDVAIASLERMAARRPQAVAFSHFGVVPGDPQAVLSEARDSVRRWAGVAERAWQGGGDVTAALTAAFGDDLAGADEAQRRRMDALNGIPSNAAGLRRWLETTRQPG